MLYFLQSLPTTVLHINSLAFPPPRKIYMSSYCMRRSFPPPMNRWMVDILLMYSLTNGIPLTNNPIWPITWSYVVLIICLPLAFLAPLTWQNQYIYIYIYLGGHFREIKTLSWSTTCSWRRSLRLIQYFPQVQALMIVLAIAYHLHLQYFELRVVLVCIVGRGGHRTLEHVIHKLKHY